jgi:hypothetical protein
MELANLGSESETCVGSHVRLVGAFISFEKNFYRLPFTNPLSGSSYRSFTPEIEAIQTEELDVGFYSPEARTSIKSPCPCVSS